MDGEVSKGRTPLEEARSWGQCGCFEMEVSGCVGNYMEGAEKSWYDGGQEMGKPRSWMDPISGS